MCAEAATRARRRFYRTLTGPLTEQQGSDIDSLLEAIPSGKASKLAWLRQPAGAPSPLNLLGLIERLNVIREIKPPTEIGQAVHQNRLLQLAREGAQSDAPHLRQLEPMRRRATLVVILLETASLCEFINVVYRNEILHSGRRYHHQKWRQIQQRICSSVI
jgi:hypothetical protein